MTLRQKIITCFVSLSLILSLLPVTALGKNTVDKQEEDETEISKNLVVTPWVLSNPAFGNGAGLISLYFYRPHSDDTVSPPSIFSLLGAYSDSESYFVSMINQNFFNEDHLRLSVGVVRAEINNELQITDLGATEFTTTVDAIFGRSLWRMHGDWFGGIQGSFSSVVFEEGNETSKEYFELYEIEDSDSTSFGIVAIYDSRDRQRLPRKGILAEISLTFNLEELGASETYEVLQASLNHFHELATDKILALRGYARLTPSGTPYSGQSTLGRGSDLRGYVSGENVAENIFSTQAEYRWQLSQKWGVVGFAGVAALFDDGPHNIDQDSLFTSGGAGVRYLINPKNNVNLRFDYAFGQDDEDGFYISLRESF